MNKFQNVTDKPLQPAPPNYADRQYLHTFLVGAMLPLVQAVITAVMAGVGTLTVLLLFDAVDVWKPTLVVSAITCVLTWIYLQRRWLTLTSLEKLTGWDLNNDKHVGEPVKAPQVVRIQVDRLEHGHIRQMILADLPISAEKLKVLANGLLMGVPFSEREWTGIRRIMSSEEFRYLRSTMLKRELLVAKSDKDHRVGFELTDAGWALMEKFGDALPEPSPRPSPVGEGAERELTDDEMEAIRRENEDYSKRFSS